MAGLSQSHVRTFAHTQGPLHTRACRFPPHPIPGAPSTPQHPMDCKALQTFPLKGLTSKESKDSPWWSEGSSESALTLSHLISLPANAFEALCLSLNTQERFSP